MDCILIHQRPCQKELLTLVMNWATHKMNPRISIMPSLRLGDSNHSHLSFIRRGLNPNPRPFPSPGRRLNRSHPLARSLRYPRPIKESRGNSLRNRVAIVLCSLRSPQYEKPSNNGSCCDCWCSLRSPKCDACVAYSCLFQLFRIIQCIRGDALGGTC